MKRLIWIPVALSIVIFAMQGCSGGGQGSASTTVAGSSQSAAASSSSSSGSQASSNSGNSQGQMIKPEQLISQSEAATLLGEAVKDGVSAENQLLSVGVCFYAAENTASKSYLQIALVQQKKEGGQGQQGGQPSASASGQSSQSSQSASGQPSASAGQAEGMTPKGLYEAIKMMFSDPNMPVTGRLGDDAFISTQGTGILYKEYFLYIAVGSATPEAAQAIVKQASELAVGNLRRLLGE